MHLSFSPMSYETFGLLFFLGITATALICAWVDERTGGTR